MTTTHTMATASTVPTADATTLARVDEELDAFDDAVSPDLYREIHKGIRYAMFHTTLDAGALDVDDDECVAAVVARCHTLVDLLEMHHHHEDVYLEPLVDVHAPELGLTVEWQHDEVERGMFRLRLLAARLADAPSCDRRRLAHRLYLELGRFTAMYLEHQLFEERQVMPALCAAVSAADLEGVHDTLKQNIAPDVMAGAMQVMMPALNVDERAAMLGGMSMAPPPIFALFRDATERALTPAQFAQVIARIGAN